MNKIDQLIAKRLFEMLDAPSTADRVDRHVNAVINRVRSIIRRRQGGMSKVANVVGGALVAKDAIETNRNPLLISEQSVNDVIDEFSATNTKYRELIAIWNMYLRDKQKNEEVVTSGAIGGGAHQPPANTTSGIAIATYPIGVPIVKRHINFEK